MQKTLTVDLGSRSYPIYIGANLLDQAELLLNHIHGKQVMVITNTSVAPLYLDKVLSHLAGLEVNHLILPDGENHKNIATLTSIFDSLLEHRHNRTTTLIALGGGVIGDTAGFAAACYQRGVNFIQIPTTLLSQVDSSVGGKTGINHPRGKNMIGAFYQPQCVIIDTNTLNTLPAREVSAGLAEVIKYGLLGDADFFAWLEDHISPLKQLQPTPLVEAIYQSCAMKAAIVAADEKEQGQRALLNLGHTFGHAIETEQGYGVWLHGEAVGAGMAMAADLSQRMGWLKPQDNQRITQLLEQAALPTQAPKTMSADTFMQHMMVDKKVTNGQLRLILLKQIGEAVISNSFSDEHLQATLSANS